MKTVYWTFNVRGNGAFPIDMLRYDRAVPRGQDDVQKLWEDKNARRIELICYLTPPSDRWGSFGWQVFDVVKRSAET